MTLGLMLIIFHFPAHGKDMVDVGRINDVDFGVWSNSGSWSTTVTNCIASATTLSKKPKGRDNVVPYEMKISNRDTGDGFYLYLNGKKTATGNQRLLISFAHRDLIEPTAYEVLNHDQYDSHFHDGQFWGCNSGDNSSLRIDINSVELSNVDNGVYIGQFQLRARNNDDNDRARFTVSITVQRGTEVKISHLDPIDFGQFSGIGNLNADERFCVYSNAASGSYRLSISAANQDAGGNFFMKDAVGGDLIPLSVLFNDSGSGPGITPVLNNFFSGIGSNTANDCGGGDNATLSLSMTAPDLRAASTGNYSELLIILVEPE